MESREFIRLTNAVIDRLGPSAFVSQPSYSRAAIDSGAWEKVVVTMVSSLIDHQVPITTASRADLGRLLDHLGEPASKLEELNIITPIRAIPA